LRNPFGRYRTGGKLQRNLGRGAGAVLALLLGAVAPSVQAQVLVQYGKSVSKTVTRHGIKIPITVPEYNNSLSVSPYSVFQFTSASRDLTTGDVTTKHTTKIGPFIQYARNFNIEQGRSTSVSLGAWYWYHGSTDSTVTAKARYDTYDRFALFTTYNFNSRIAIQANAGGITRVGFTEYYGFLLYQYAPPASLHTRFNAAQVGFGPYFPRTSYGSTGYTATGGVGYDLNDRYSITGNVWYVNYDAPAPDFGSNFKTKNSLTRALFNLNYRF